MCTALPISANSMPGASLALMMTPRPNVCSSCSSCGDGARSSEQQRATGQHMWQIGHVCVRNAGAVLQQACRCGAGVCARGWSHTQRRWELAGDADSVLVWIRQTPIQLVWCNQQTEHQIRTDHATALIYMFAI